MGDLTCMIVRIGIESPKKEPDTYHLLGHTLNDLQNRNNR
jgi:hypothetical protein